MINPTIIPVRLAPDESLNDWIFNHANEKELHIVFHRGWAKLVYKDNHKSATIWDSVTSVKKEDK